MPFFDQAMDLDIIGHICQEQYDDVIGKIDSGNVYEKALIELLRKAIANWTLYRAIPHIRIAFESNALVFVSSSDGMNMKKDAHDNAISQLRAQCFNDATEYTAKVKGYLYNNVDEFPIFKEKGYVSYPTQNVIASPDGVGGVGVF